MKWVDGDSRIASGLTALVWESAFYGPWAARVETNAGSMVWRGEGYANETEAKAAVCYWIGKTMAQFSNALAEGCPQVDED